MSGEALCLGTQLVSEGSQFGQPRRLPPVRLKAARKGFMTSQSSIVIWGQVFGHRRLLGGYFTCKL